MTREEATEILFCLVTVMALFYIILEFCFDKDADLVFRIAFIVLVLAAAFLLFTCCAALITSEEVK